MTKGRRPPLSIVGLGCRLMNVQSGEAAAAALRGGPALFAELPEDRWPRGALDVELPEGSPNAAPRAALLESFDIDWRALRLPPHTAERMHRMERVALATMASALADANIKAHGKGHARARVFIGAPTLSVDPLTDHGRRIRRFELASPVSQALSEVFADEEREHIDELIEQLFNLAAPPIDPDSMTTSATIAAGRTTNLFDLRGGHMSVDAGMSSGLAALDAASAALATGACDLAVVCGVSPLVTASQILAHAHRHGLGADEPAPFSAHPSGTVLGEGCAAVVLTRSGEEGGRRVYATLDGIGSAGALPGREVSSVRDAACAALKAADLDASDVFGVVSRAAGLEAHDDAEARGLALAYAAKTGEPGPLLSSSVGRFGFLQGASGLVALLEACVALEQGTWFGPPRPGPVSVSGLRFDAGCALPPGARIGVSDAGMSATSFHAILSAPSISPRASPAAMTREPLAIVGVGAIVPDADDIKAMWRNVLSGAQATGDLPGSRWDVDALLGNDAGGELLKTRLAGTVRVPAIAGTRPASSGTKLEDADPAVSLALKAAEEALEGITSLHLERTLVAIGQLPLRWNEMEVEARILFQGHIALCAQALEEAGVEEEVTRRIIQDARRRFSERSAPLTAASLDAFTGSSAPADIAAQHGFGGGAISIDAACASSLAALELAAQKLALGEIDAALVGGVAFNLVPEYYVSLSMLGALSPKGAPPFDVGSDGFVPAEAAGLLVVKRLSDAEAAGDEVLAVVEGIGAASDGRGLSIFAPRKEGQVLAISRALDAADAYPDDVDYLEAHGTGTKLGDSTELSAYEEMYGRRDPALPLAIGTIKSQIGHPSSAAGAVALVKVALAFKHGIVPPSNADTIVEPDSPFANGPFTLAATPTAWTRRDQHRRTAAVSAFGIGGINYHVILREPPRSEADLKETAQRGPVASLPARGAEADRFVVELAPVALPSRDKLVSLVGRRMIVLPDESGALAAALERALEQRGARPLVLPRDEVQEDASLEAAIERFGPENVGGVFDLSAFGARAFDPAALPSLVDEARRAVKRSLALARGLYDVLEDAAPRTFPYVVVSTLGGDLGLLGTTSGDLLGGAQLGFLKALKQELPRVHAKGIDFSPYDDPLRVATQVLDEVQDGNERMEVGYLGRRLVAGLRRENFAEHDRQLRPPRPGDVWLLSGGGRGVVFECALGLSRLGVRTVVFGRSPLPDGEAEWLHLDEGAFESFWREELTRRRKTDPSLTPGRFEREMQGLKHQRELWRNLRRVEAQRLPLEYVVCDVTSPDAVRDLVRDVRARYGRLDGVVHGAMVEWSKSIPKKRSEHVDKTLDTKLLGLAHLLDAVKDDPPPSIVCFGSGAGRFGNRGQSDYAAANNLMSVMLQSWARHTRYAGRACTIDWTAWRGAGAAVATPEMAEVVKATGVSSVSIDEGLYWFLNELALGSAGESLICAERMLSEWPFLGPSADGVLERSMPLDDRGGLLVKGAFPLVDRVLERAPGRVLLERRFEVADDHFLPQHTLYGDPILPATFGCELLAEAAALSSPGWEVASLHDVEIGIPVKLHRGRPMLLRAVAELVREHGKERTVDVTTTSDLYLKGQLVQAGRVHHRCRVSLVPAGSRRTRREAIERPDGPVRARSFFHMARGPVGLGPMYSRAQWIHLLDDGAVGEVRAPRMRDLCGRTSFPHFQVDPLVLDGAFQIAANWDGYTNGWVNIPFSVKSLGVGRLRQRGEHARVRGIITRVKDPDVYYDVVVTGDDDEVLFEIRGLHMRRVPNEAAVDEPVDA